MRRPINGKRVDEEAQSVVRNTVGEKDETLQSDSGLWSQSIQADRKTTSWLYSPPHCPTFHLSLFLLASKNFSNVLLYPKAKDKKILPCRRLLHGPSAPPTEFDSSLPPSPLSLSPLMKPNELPYWQNHIPRGQRSELEIHSGAAADWWGAGWRGRAALGKRDAQAWSHCQPE